MYTAVKDKQYLHKHIDLKDKKLLTTSCTVEEGQRKSSQKVLSTNAQKARMAALGLE